MNNIRFDETELGGTIHARFERVAATVPDRIAVTAHNRSITYDALNRAANRLAHALLANHARPSWPVPTLFDHDIDAIIAVLGVLKAGRAYVALDANQPAARLANIASRLDADVLVTGANHLPLADEIGAGAVVTLDADAALPETNPGVYPEADSLASISFTSGSTGEPKGVMRDHWPILHRQWVNATAQPDSLDDRISMLYGCQFGAASSDLFSALFLGETLCMYDFGRQGLHNLTGWMFEQGITYLHIPVDLFRPWLDSLPADAFFPALRQIAPAGRYYWRDIEKARRHIPPECTFVSRFSSNETMMAACLLIDQDTPVEDGVVAVGYPAPGFEIAILNEQGEPAADNEVGEAIITGAQITRGYWRQPELTAKSIHDHPQFPGVRVCRNGDYLLRRPNGCLEFHGRQDDRVKIRGNTVEVAEVEAALLRLPDVQTGAVLARDSGGGDKMLVAYVVPSHPADFEPSRLRRALNQTLPSYMLPAAFVPLAELPLTANAKIDRRTLAAMEIPLQRGGATGDYRPPETASEMLIAGIWCEVLAIETVGIDDNFLDLGGNSILAARILARINAVFGVDLPFAVLFDAPTVAALAKAVDVEAGSTMDDLAALLDAIEMDS
ncbi:MAG: non-ribosomal peptide synthetase [Caldilineales bacterium]|nr:non-ribosomal peptide synthetase [Caldilineales bacterium]